MANIERSGKWVTNLGTTIVEIDDRGVKNVNAHYYNALERFNFRIDANSVDTFVWVCDGGIWQLVTVAEAHTVAGGAVAACQVVVCPQSVAIASGIAQLTAALDLTLTAPGHSFGTLIAAPTQISRGDAIGLDLSGTLTALVGCVTICVGRVG